MRSSVALLVTLALAGCTGTRAAPVAPPSSTTSAAGSLAAAVPAETPYAVFLERPIFDGPVAAAWVDSLRVAVARSVAEGLNDGADTAEGRFWIEIGRALGQVDEAGLQALGWWPGRSEAVIYGVGLVPVVRVRADGVRLAALVRRAAASADFALIEGSAAGRPYLVIPDLDEPDAAVLVLATSDDQVAMAVTRHPDEIAPHLTSFGPLDGPSLATAWPQDDAAHLLVIDPARVAERLADRRELAHLTATAATGRCVPALRTLMAALPRTTATMRSDAERITVALGLDLSAKGATPWRGGGAPAWTADPGAVPTMRFGFGVEPLPVLAQLATPQALLVAADAACDDESGEGDAAFLARAVTALAYLQGVQGMTWEMTVVGGGELTMSVAVATRDVAALWSVLARQMPFIGATVPAIGELRDAPGAPMKFGVGPGLIAGSMGAHAGPRLKALLAASPGPRMPVAIRLDRSFLDGWNEKRFRILGQTFGEDDDSEVPPLPNDVVVESSLDGQHLEIRAHFQTR